MLWTNKTEDEMKKRIYIIIFWCLTLLLAACVETKIPARSQEFIDRFFPESSVVIVEKDMDIDGQEKYEVWLNDGTKIQFSMHGDWKVVARKKTGVPLSLIPPQIVGFVKSRYPDNVVTKFSRKDYGYKLELSDDMDLRFNKQYQFIEEID
jgi:hypothetical protein